MNDIFAKIQSRNEPGIYKAISGKQLFVPLNIPDECKINYDPAHKLDDDCWFVISDFSTHKFFLDILKDNFTSLDYNQLPKKEFEKISFIFSVQDGDFYFQKITKGRIINKTRLIAFGESAKMQEINNSLQINDFPDAVYFKKEDALLFRSLERISSIFKGIESLYREATDEETKKFLGNSFIALADDYNIDKVKKLNRKRIAMAIDKIKEITEKDKEMLLSYIAEYCKTLKFDKENLRFTISNEGDLKSLLDGLSENYYTTEISKERRRSNSNHAID